MTDTAPAGKANPADKKIILIDDDDAVLSMLRTTLELEGFQVRTLRDGRTIQKASSGFIPDLVVTDLMMPGGGGYEVLRTLQGDPSTRGVPIIMVTGSHMDSSTKDMFKQEANLVHYFEKPIRPERLVKQIHQILNTLTKAEQQSQFNKDVPLNFKDIF